MRVSCPPMTDLIFHTLAADFSKDEAVKEISDNAMQSVTLHFHALHTTAVAGMLHATFASLVSACSDPACNLHDDLTIKVRWLAEFFDPAWVGDGVTASDDKLQVRQQCVDDLLHLERGASFISAVGKRNLSELLRAFSHPKMAELRKVALDAVSAHNWPAGAMDAFWSAAGELARCVLERKAPEQIERPRIVLTFDLPKCTFSCADNGGGMDSATVAAIFQSGKTGHGRDEAIGRGGKAFSRHCGSLCSGQISAYGVGAKASSARLCKPDDAELREGSLQVRSILLSADGEPQITSAMMDFAAMKAEEAATNENPWSYIADEHPEWTIEERALLVDPEPKDLDWGGRLTCVTVADVDPGWYRKLESVEVREQLVSFFNDVYYPLIHDGFEGLPATRPLQCVEIELEFRLGEASTDTYLLRQSEDPQLLKCLLEPYPTIRDAGLPTIKELLERNKENVEHERELHEAQYLQLAAMFGKELSLRLLVDLPPLPGADSSAPKQKALLLFFYLPLHMDEETCFGSGANGLFAVHNGCRLFKQPPLIWPWMMKPQSKRNVDKTRREILSDGCYERVSGLIFLPPAWDITKNKARLSDECSTALMKLDPAQVPTVLGAELGAGGGPAPSRLRARQQADAAATGGSSAAPLPDTLDGKRLDSLYLDVYLAKMRLRDADVLVSDSARSELLPNTVDDWKLHELTYLKKKLSTQADGLWVLYRQPKAAKSTPKTLGRVLHFVAHGGRPDPAKSSRDEYSMCVERRSLDDKFGKQEEVFFAQVEEACDLDLSRRDLEAHERKERKKVPTRLSMFGCNKGGEGNFAIDGARLDALPDWIALCADLPSCKESARWPSELPLQLKLLRVDQGGVQTSAGKKSAALRLTPLSRQDNNGKERPHPNGFHYFSLPNSLPKFEPGSYQLEASMRTGISKLLDHVKVAAVSARLEIVPGEAVSAYVVRIKSGEEDTEVMLGGGPLPDVYIVCTDKHGRAVKVGADTTLKFTAEAVSEKHAERELKLSSESRHALEQVAVDALELPRALSALCGEVPAIRVSGLVLRSGFKLPVDVKAAADSPAAPPSMIKPYRLRLSFELGAVRAGASKPAPFSEGGAGLLLAPGPPVKLTLQRKQQEPLTLGGLTHELIAYALDEWGNVVVRGEDGAVLNFACDADGLDLAERDVHVWEEGPKRGRCALPQMRLTADFGTRATLRLQLRRGKLPSLSAEESWEVSPRLLAFHVEGTPEPQVARAADGALVTQLQLPFGKAIEDIRVCVHHPPPAGSAALLGAADSSFSPRSELKLEVADSGERKARKLLPVHEGAASIGWSVCAPKAGGDKPRELRATLGGAAARLLITGQQGPPAGLRLTAPQLPSGEAVSGERFELHAVVVDSAGELHKQCPQLDWAQVRVRAVSADGSSALLPAGGWLALPGSRGGPVGAARAHSLSALGAYTLRLEGAEGLDAFRAAREEGALAPPAEVKLHVRAGPPSELRLAVDGHSAEEGAFEVFNAQRFAMSASAFDVVGNECAELASLGACTLRIEQGGVVFAPDAKNAACCTLTVKPQGKPPSCKWGKLHLRPAAGASLPAECSLVAQMALPGGAQLRSPPFRLKLTASGQPHAIDVQHGSYSARLKGDHVEVKARLLLDTGEPASKTLSVLFLERPGELRAGARKASAAQAASVPSSPVDFDAATGWWSFRVPPPASVGKHTWWVGTNVLGELRAAVMVKCEEEAIEDIDATQEPPPLRRSDSQDTVEALHGLQSEEPVPPAEPLDESPIRAQRSQLSSLPPGSQPPEQLPPGSLPPGSQPPEQLPPGSQPPGSQPPSQRVPVADSQQTEDEGASQRAPNADPQLTRPLLDDPASPDAPHTRSARKAAQQATPASAIQPSASARLPEQSQLEMHEFGEQAVRAELVERQRAAAEASAALAAAQKRDREAKEAVETLEGMIRDFSREGAEWKLTQAGLATPQQLTPVQRGVAESVKKRLRDQEELSAPDAAASGGRPRKQHRI